MKKNIIRVTAIALCAVFGFSAFTACSSTMGGTKYAETPIEEGIELVPMYAINVYYGAAIAKFDLSGYTLELSCDNAFLYDEDYFLNNETVSRDSIIEHGETSMDDLFYKSQTTDGVYNAYIRGKQDGYSLYNMDDYDYMLRLDEPDSTLRAIIKDGESIAGYALICFWGANTEMPQPTYEYGKVVKAVMFDKVDGEYPDVTADEVNKLLDEARDELVVKAKLFETKVSM
ncbi:MAG: hypothetical protein J1E60_03230 [Christensenellaceae bacterium]|nr:hypothetical protein [Christensenellaceae bacterium]